MNGHMSVIRTETHSNEYELGHAQSTVNHADNVLRLIKEPDADHAEHYHR